MEAVPPFSSAAAAAATAELAGRVFVKCVGNQLSDRYAADMRLLFESNSWLTSPAALQTEDSEAKVKSVGPRSQLFFNPTPLFTVRNRNWLRPMG